MSFVELETIIGDRSFALRSDADYAHHIQSEFEPDTVKLMTSLTRAKDNALDVGANIGCTMLLLAQLTNSVKAFEPAPSTFGLLEQNLQANPFVNVELFNLGLGAQAEETEITFAPQNRSGGFVSNKTTASHGHILEKIKIVVGDSLNLDADFIKLDVEGFEMSVMQGLVATIARCKPVVMFEVNHWCLNAFQRIALPDFIDFVADLFPICYAVEGGQYLDIQNPSDRYIVTYNNIIRNRYQNFVGGFDSERLEQFRAVFNYGDIG